MMLFGLMSCVFYLPLIAVAVLCVIVLWRSLTSAGVAGSQCGGCGYAVESIPGTTCPECGRDLLTVGVVTRSVVGRYRSSMLLAQLAWAGAWGGFSMILGWVVLMVYAMSSMGGFAGGGAVAVTGTITPTGAATHGPIGVDVSSTGWGQLTTVTLSITSEDGSLHEIELDGQGEPLSAVVWTDGAEVWSDSSVMIGPALDEWFAAAGIDDGTDPNSETRRDVDQYATAVTMSAMTADAPGVLSWSTLNVTSATGTMNTTAMNFGPTGSGAVWSMVAGLALVAVYIAGIVFIVRRRRKLMRLV